MQQQIGAIFARKALTVLRLLLFRSLAQRAHINLILELVTLQDAYLAPVALTKMLLDKHHATVAHLVALRYKAQKNAVASVKTECFNQAMVGAFVNQATNLLIAIWLSHQKRTGRLIVSQLFTIDA